MRLPSVRAHVGVVACVALAAAVLGTPFPESPDSPDEAGPAIRLSGTTDQPSAPPTTAPPAAAPEPEPRQVSLVMGGDLLWHDTVWQSAARDARDGAPYDFDPMFADIRPLIADADLALCHSEVPFAAPGGPLQSYPVFAAPPEIAPWIASMGWDACTTASNHALDQGFDGLARTASLLEQHGVAHVGTFRTARERREPVVLTTTSGVRVGVVAGTYGLNGFPLPEGREWSVSMLDVPDLLRQARAARRAGADVVVVHLHAGYEYDELPNAEQVAAVERLTRSPDVDLVLGEHAHTVQPITQVNGKWVAYGMGNLVAQQEVTRPETYRGILVRFVFVELPDGSFEVRRAAYVPVGWNHIGSGPIRVRRLDDPGDEAARAAVVAAVNGLGRAPGLRAD
jgi:poly-gamma-glutamate capsule biosynthesis protein CapA/YwtB (metallophosphatase superfamily)